MGANGRCLVLVAILLTAPTAVSSASLGKLGTADVVCPSRQSYMVAGQLEEPEDEAMLKEEDPTFADPEDRDVLARLVALERQSAEQDTELAKLKQVARKLRQHHAKHAAAKAGQEETRASCSEAPRCTRCPRV
mmetsp:Transcript_22146/g.62083  ORF Transcript_22146/g.62083 Transcript_22146/m.62083 type:complete len:134 (-) Transcript_22146:237-638(-)|eukprot:CAMPEP_0117558700 /NCGR_PEP_ID=MMETSP0784-20121206/52975_1 /TAXON_ID=39447 /ORGANISM="" /LENGTH=133 /DNA_ID=CAMNT_0005356045 /DNA_START=120 /DNA_END=521 /DNA_ORIENTATION=+